MNLVFKITRTLAENSTFCTASEICLANLLPILHSQGRRKQTEHFCIDASLILLNSVILLVITPCITFNGKPLIQRVIAINLISASSVDSLQIIKSLCVRFFIRLIFYLAEQK